MNILLFLLLPFAFLSGWLVARKTSSSQRDAATADLPSAYFEGLNFLINSETDRAIETFLKVAEVDSQTIDTHLALGALYRSRGEVQRAITIHRNLVDRKNLSKTQRAHALMNLAKDYLAAGLLDRSEVLLQELAESGRYKSEALLLLVDIYQQEREWYSAIDVAKRYSVISENPMHEICAHFYCELAEEFIRDDELGEAGKVLKHALGEDADCVRASILKGKVELLRGNNAAALRAFRNVATQDPCFLPEVSNSLKKCYTNIGEETKYFEFLSQQYGKSQDPNLMILMAESILERDGAQAAIEFLMGVAERVPTVIVFHKILDIGLSSQQNLSYLEPKYQLIHSLLEQTVEGGARYRCGHCGFETKALHWNCPSCGQWGQVKRLADIPNE